MWFGLQRLVHLMVLYFFKRKTVPDAHRRSISFCLAFCALFVLFESLNALCFLLDALFFPRYRGVVLQAPIFMIGSPRSGKSTLQRLLASDRARFFCFRTWEIIFPAIVQKALLAGIGRLDRATGGHCRRLYLRWEARKLAKYREDDHAGLFLPEEDDKLLAHILACPELDLLFPYAGFEGLLRLDLDVAPSDQHQIMRFYLRCVQRQAHLTGGDRCFLSQTPLFSGAVQNLLRVFPDARFIYLVRSPLDVIPALIDLVGSIVRSRFDREPGPDFEERIYQAAKVFYQHPLEVLSSLPQERFMAIRFESFVQQPKEVVRRVYKRFGLPWTQVCEQRVEELVGRLPTREIGAAAERAACSISDERIATDLEPIFKRFGFAMERQANSRPIPAL
jgi:hypothetical protein